MKNKNYSLMDIVVDTMHSIAVAMAILLFLLVLSNLICWWLGI